MKYEVVYYVTYSNAIEVEADDPKAAVAATRELLIPTADSKLVKKIAGDPENLSQVEILCDGEQWDFCP